MAAPSLSAMPSSSLKFSPLPMPRPPETTTLAAPSSGRSLWASSSPTKLDWALSTTTSTASMAALPSSPTASKAVARTVITFRASSLCTVAMALPA